MFQRPLLRAPARHWTSEDELSGRQLTFGLALWQRKFIEAIRGAGRGRKIEILVDPMYGIGMHTPRVKPCGRLLTHAFEIEPVETFRTSAGRDQCGFDEALKIGREIEALTPQFAPGFANTGDRAALQRDQPVDVRVPFEQLPPFRFDNPREFGLRFASLQAGDGGQRLDDVAHGAEPHHQHSCHAEAPFDLWRTCSVKRRVMAESAESSATPSASTT